MPTTLIVPLLPAPPTVGAAERVPALAAASPAPAPITTPPTPTATDVRINCRRVIPRPDPGVCCAMAFLPGPGPPGYSFRTGTGRPAFSADSSISNAIATAGEHERK